MADPRLDQSESKKKKIIFLNSPIRNPSLVAIQKIFLVDFSPFFTFNPEIWFLFQGQEGFSPNEVQAIGINSRKCA
jgi:hypothetical protein